jgi:hypothetical protein
MMWLRWSPTHGRAILAARGQQQFWGIDVVLAHRLGKAGSHLTKWMVGGLDSREPLSFTKRSSPDLVVKYQAAKPQPPKLSKVIIKILTRQSQKTPTPLNTP